MDKSKRTGHPTLQNILNRLDDLEKKMSDDIEAQFGKRKKDKKKRSKAGRPPNNPDEGPADFRINVRFTKQQRDDLIEFLKAGEDTTISEFVRKLIIKELKRMKPVKVKDPKTF